MKAPAEPLKARPRTRSAGARASFGLAVLLLSFTDTACQKPVSRGVQLNTTLKKAVSADTTVLGGVAIDNLVTTDFYKRHQALLDTPLLHGFTEQTGLNLQKDVKELLFSFDGKAILIAARGHFKENRVKNLPNLSTKRYNGHQLLCFRDDAVSILNQELLLGGNVPSVEKAIDTWQKGDSTVPDELAEAMARVDTTNQVWLVSRGGLPFADLPMRTEFASFLANISGYVRSSAWGAAVDSDLGLKGRIDCISEQGSKRVNDALRGGIGLARLTIKERDLDDARLLSAIQITRDGQTVLVRAQLTQDLADRLLSRMIQYALRH